MTSKNTPLDSEEDLDPTFSGKDIDINTVLKRKRGRPRKATTNTISELAPTDSAAMIEDTKEDRKDSLLHASKKSRFEGLDQLPLTPASLGETHDPPRRQAKNKFRNEPRHIYVCAYYDDLLTPNDDEERKRRSHLAFKWDLFVKRASIDASGTHFRLTTQYVRPRNSAMGGAEPLWTPRDQI